MTVCNLPIRTNEKKGGLIARQKNILVGQEANLNSPL
jgi:hypothetical protein